jgi:hypothetical protein
VTSRQLCQKAEQTKAIVKASNEAETKARHLNRRNIFKQNRSVALAEWRQLAA